MSSLNSSALEAIRVELLVWRYSLDLLSADFATLESSLLSTSRLPALRNLHFTTTAGCCLIDDEDLVAIAGDIRTRMPRLAKSNISLSFCCGEDDRA